VQPIGLRRLLGLGTNLASTDPISPNVGATLSEFRLNRHLNFRQSRIHVKGVESRILLMQLGLTTLIISTSFSMARGKQLMRSSLKII
jgi:hypothetical protein